MPDVFKSDFYFLRTSQFNVNFTHNYFWDPFFYSLFGIVFFSFLPGVNWNQSSSAQYYSFDLSILLWIRTQQTKWNKERTQIIQFRLNRVNYMNKIAIHYISFVGRSIFYCVESVILFWKGKSKLIFVWL